MNKTPQDSTGTGKTGVPFETIKKAVSKGAGSHSKEGTV